MQPLDIELVEAMLRDAFDAEQTGEIERLSRLLDELDEAKRARSVPLVSAALWYAEQGLRVFPLMPLSKRPWPKSHGCHDATTDADRIREWWAAAPTSNVGIATGHIVDVIDVDGLEAHRELMGRFADDESWQRFERIVVGRVSTPRPGGLHLYVLSTQRARGNRAKMQHSKLDYRGAGGYVVAPPSTTDARDSQVAGVYRWTSALSL